VCRRVISSRNVVKRIWIRWRWVQRLWWQGRLYLWRLAVAYAVCEWGCITWFAGTPILHFLTFVHSRFWFQDFSVWGFEGICDCMRLSFVQLLWDFEAWMFFNSVKDDKCCVAKCTVLLLIGAVAHGTSVVNHWTTWLRYSRFSCFSHLHPLM
jgi:hypothetical protein